MRRAELEKLADDVLREALVQSGFHHAAIVEKPDEQGETALYVDVYFEPQPPDVRGLPFLSVIAELRKRLLDHEEERFPYVHYVLTDDEVVDDEDEAADA